MKLASRVILALTLVLFVTPAAFSQGADPKAADTKAAAAESSDSRSNAGMGMGLAMIGIGVGLG